MNRKCLIWLGETLLAREKKLNSCLNRKSNNHRGEIEDFTISNKEPFFFRSIKSIFSISIRPSYLINKTIDISVRSILTLPRIQERSNVLIGFSLRRIYTNRFFVTHTMTFGSRENCRQQLTSLIFITAE